MSDLATTLSEACADAFEAIGLERKWGAVRRSDRAELADFQCNGAMGSAKQAGRNPRDVAAEIAAKIKDHPAIASVEVAGPGFLNIRVSADGLAKRAAAIAADAMAGGALAPDPQVTVIDFGGPNVAKPMHVGHLRSAVIGDALQRILRFSGDPVTSDVHLGDWGLQMGHLVTELEDEQPDLIYFDDDFEGPYPEDPPVTIEDLARLYPQASTKAKADEARNERSQAAVAELQAGRPGYRALLRHFIDVSVAALKQDYAFLDVSFDLWKGESDVDHLIAGLVEDFKAKGLAREDDGAWIVDVATAGENVPVEKKGKTTLKNAMPPIMLVNSRGGTGYHTTDLATIADRLASLDPTPERMIYVVDQRQALHFEQVFRAADRAGMIARDRLEHIGFGTVNGTDGKPFKTREGGTLRLADLFKLTLGSVKEKLLSKDRETRKIVVQEGLVESVNRNFRDVSSLPKVKLCQLFVRLMMTVRKTYHSDRFLVSLENENLKKVLDASLEQDDVEAAHIFYAYIYPKKKYKVIEKAILLLISIRLDGVPLESSNEIRESLFREMIDYIENQYCAPIARAALRFADLQNTRTTNYVFDLDRFTSFEGKTGPYLLYAAVRIKSLLRRASDEGLKSGRIIIESDAERALVLALDGFGAAVLAARDKRMPHILCEHVYGLAQAFSAFYGAHPIAAEAVAKTRASRLALSAAVLKQLETGLDLLGIAVPDRM